MDFNLDLSIKTLQKVDALSLACSMRYYTIFELILKQYVKNDDKQLKIDEKQKRSDESLLKIDQKQLSNLLTIAIKKSLILN